MVETIFLIVIVLLCVVAVGACIGASLIDEEGKFRRKESYRIVPIKEGYFRVEERYYGGASYTYWRTPGGRDWTKYYTDSLEKAEEIVRELRNEKQRGKAKELARQREQKQFRKNNPIRYF